MPIDRTSFDELAAAWQIFETLGPREDDPDPATEAAGAPAGGAEVQIVNGRPEGAIAACARRAGRLLAHKTGVAPGQKVVLRHKPASARGPRP